MRIPKNVRIFDGKKYIYFAATTTKTGAKEEAKKERKKGWSVRTVTDKYGYRLYKRKRR